MLYEERRFSRFTFLITLPAYIGLLAGLWGTYHAGEGFEVMVAVFIVIVMILIDLLSF